MEIKTITTIKNPLVIFFSLVSGFFIGIVAVLTTQILHIGFWIAGAIYAGIAAIMVLNDYIDARLFYWGAKLFGADKNKLEILSYRSKFPTYWLLASYFIGILVALIVPTGSLSHFLGIILNA